MAKIKIISPLVVLFMILCSCTNSLPGEMPDIGMNVDELEFNNYFTITAPKQMNDFKTDNTLTLEVINISDYEWFFNVTQDILIYEYKNEGWKKVFDKMVTLGETDLKLGRAGIFPNYQYFIGILPEIKVDQKSFLRIIILAEGELPGNGNQVKGAYVDVLLRP